ncbi:MAG: hypothetical protein C4K58_02765 [Flavobacteriaceae bacterium]|nr:MAG: hypothetical protein C4K58_02765 [Flavobacteriaceae bacterium]
MKLLESPFGFYNKQQKGILLFLFLNILLFFAGSLLRFQTSRQEKNNSFLPLDTVGMGENHNPQHRQNSDTQSDLPISGSLDPNRLSYAQWQELGFSFKQAQSIINYKNSLGGFTSLEQISRCYVISPEKFQALKSKFVFSKVQSNQTQNFSSFKSENHQTKQYPKKKIINSNQLKKEVQNYALKPFDPNVFNQEDWMKIGFSASQSAVILRYKASLGGRFSSIEQIKSCYVIDQQKFDEISPFIRLKLSESIKPIEQKQEPVVRAVDKFVLFLEVNSATAKDFENLGFSISVSNRIVKYRNSLGGFKDLSELKKVYYIDTILLKKVSPMLRLNDK